MTLKSTKQRSAIQRLLEAAAEPVSAEELHALLTQDQPSLALSTVYRNLERFAQEGLVRRDVLGDGVVRYAPAGEHGHYLVCTGCAAKVKIDECPLHRLEQGLEKDTGFQIQGHSLTIYGKCPACTKKENSD